MNMVNIRRQPLLMTRHGIDLVHDSFLERSLGVDLTSNVKELFADCFVMVTFLSIEYEKNIASIHSLSCQEVKVLICEAVSEGARPQLPSYEPEIPVKQFITKMMIAEF